MPGSQLRFTRTLKLDHIPGLGAEFVSITLEYPEPEMGTAL